MGTSTDTADAPTIFGDLSVVSNIAKGGKSSADAALGYTQELIRDLGVNGANPNAYEKLKLLENAVTEIKKTAEDLTRGQDDSADMVKQVLDLLNQKFSEAAKQAGLADTMTVAELSEKQAKDMQKVNEKLEEITAKINALREAMEVQDVVVKTWFESEE